MDILITVFNEIIFRPLINFLVVILNFLPGSNLGLAIIVVTLIARFLLYPLSHKALKSQRQMANLQPQLKEIQKKHKNNKEARSRAIMEFYKENKVNPFSGCLPFLVQLPLIIGLYRVFLSDLTPEGFSGLYSFVSTPEFVNTMFLGFLNLSEPSLALAILAGFSQFLLSKSIFSQRKKIGIATTSKKGDFQSMMGTQMTYVLPVVTVFIAQSFPSGLVLYWFVTTVFSFAQQYVINKTVK